MEYIFLNGNAYKRYNGTMCGFIYGTMCGFIFNIITYIYLNDEAWNNTQGF